MSHASKVMLKILQARLQQYMNHELPDVQAGFRKGRGTSRLQNLMGIQQDRTASFCRRREKQHSTQYHQSIMLPCKCPNFILHLKNYSAIKKNTFESVLMRWMKLGPIIQSEVSQKGKHQHSILTHIYGI